MSETIIEKILIPKLFFDSLIILSMIFFVVNTKKSGSPKPDFFFDNLSQIAYWLQLFKFIGHSISFTRCKVDLHSPHGKCIQIPGSLIT